MENAYKILDIIKELKSNHIVCYYDQIVMLQKESMGLKTQLQIII